jgi:hypothetical protein
MAISHIFSQSNPSFSSFHRITESLSSITMSFEVPAPKSLLGRHRLLAPSAGVFVSPICLGAMNFGDFWKDMMGVCDKETTFNILEYFYQKGGNFIDT